MFFGKLSGLIVLKKSNCKLWAHTLKEKTLFSQVLLKHGAGIETKNNEEHTPLMIASLNGHSDVVEVSSYSVLLHTTFHNSEFFVPVKAEVLLQYSSENLQCTS